MGVAGGFCSAQILIYVVQHLHLAYFLVWLPLYGQCDANVLIFRVNVQVLDEK